MMKEESSDGSGQEILYCGGNNEDAIYFSHGFTARFIVCLLSGDSACFINMTTTGPLNIQLDSFLEI